MANKRSPKEEEAYQRCVNGLRTAKEQGKMGKCLHGDARLLLDVSVECNSNYLRDKVIREFLAGVREFSLAGSEMRAGL